MKAIILAGGKAQDYIPLHSQCYNKPMIYYPLSLIMLLGIKNVLFIVNPTDLDTFKELFGDGSHLGMNIKYRIQQKPNGLAEGLILAEDFIEANNIYYILEDNIFLGMIS